MNPELPNRRRPLRFSYQSSGGETRFTNGLDPQPRSRPVFAFHRPGRVAEMLENAATWDTKNPVGAAPSPRFASVADASAS